jgi:pimeloyl-ACP methyl ester carboxylesterase
LLYSRAEWPHLDEVLLEADRGDSGSLYDVRDWFSRKDSRRTEPADPTDAQFVINCNEMPLGPPEHQLRTQAAQLVNRYPRFGPLGSWWLLGCTSWTAPRHPLEAPHAPSTPPVLVIGTEHDPATPYSGAVEFTKSLGGNATLLTWAGDGHTAFGQSACIGEHVVAYLVDGAVPAVGATCPASP